MTKNTLIRSASITALLATSAVTFVPNASAQQTANGERDEIIVTATKREQRIIDVPLAITAIGGDEIEERGALTIKDLQYSVPGLNIQELSGGAAQVTLRGINPGFGTGLPIVGVYVDEVGISVDQQQRFGSFPLADLERIEVLRGPQGTLYGQGSVAGTIRYITKNPDLTSPGGYVEGNVYTQEEGEIGYRANGAVGIPLQKDVLGLRVTAGYDRLSGWIDFPAIADGDEVNQTERFYLRPKLLFKPNDQLTASLLYQYFDEKVDSNAVSSTTMDYIKPGRTLLLPSSDKGHLLNGIVEYDFGSVSLVSSTGYQDRAFQQSGDFGFLFESGSDFKIFNQEVRLTSTDEGPFQYTIGAFYRDYKDEGFSTFGMQTSEAQSWAVFGEGSYAITDQLEIIAGGAISRIPRNRRRTRRGLQFLLAQIITKLQSL